MVDSARSDDDAVRRSGAGSTPLPRAVCALTGVALLGLFALLLAMSRRFVYGSDMLGRPIIAAAGVLVLAGGFYLAAVWAVRRLAGGGRLLIWILVVGAGLRVLVFLSSPILEDDFYRYLWDGAVVAQGMNPYARAPAESDPALDRLKSESGLVGSRVNHSDLRTIYPPAAQGAFALAHWIRPWSLGAWKLVLLAGDMAAAALLIVLLRRLQLPVVWIVVYWWNPLIIKETFNSAHVDVLAVPFVLAALLLSMRRRSGWAAAALAVGVGVKLWPILLLPVILRPALRRPGRAAAALLVFVALTAALFAPVFLAGFDERSGGVQYVRRWERNDALFMSIRWCVRGALSAAGGDAGLAPLAARGAAALIFLIWAAWLLRRPPDDGVGLCDHALLLPAGLFLLSPTQFPWYAIMFLPLLAVRLRWPLLLLTALLPIYYLRFHLRALGRPDLFTYGVVWAQYVPVWIWIVVEWRRTRARRRPAMEAVL